MARPQTTDPLLIVSVESRLARLRSEVGEVESVKRSPLPAEEAHLRLLRLASAVDTLAERRNGSHE